MTPKFEFNEIYFFLEFQFLMIILKIFHEDWPIFIFSYLQNIFIFKKSDKKNNQGHIMFITYIQKGLTMLSTLRLH